MTPGTAVRQIALVLAFICCTWMVLYAGWLARRWTWDHTSVIRFAGDMQNAWRWGSRAASEGYVGLYDRVYAEHPDGQYQLDYVPLRLAVMTLWARHERQRIPGAERWQNTYEFNRPLLLFNTAMEFAAALAVFALTRMWARRGNEGSALGPEWLALAAFALAWLNPASLISSHGRPTWDVWVAPFYLWAVYAACRDRWFTAGCIIAVGAMFKGQQLVAAPVFLIWPMIGLRFGAAGRWLIGFALASAIIVSPWIVPLRFLPIAATLVLAAFWPALWLWRRTLVPASWLRWLVPLSLAFALWAGAWLFGGTFSWFKIGFIYGAEKFPSLEMGGASSLASILQNRFGWRHDMEALTVPWIAWTLSIRDALAVFFCVLLFVSCIAMCLAQRRGDRSFLLAMAAPWIVYFAVFPQMHERYLLWGAIAACAGAGCGLAPSLLAVFFGICSTIMSLSQLLNRGNATLFLAEYSPGLGRELWSFVSQTYPDIAWAILLATAIWLYLCLLPSRPKRPQIPFNAELKAKPVDSRPCGGSLDRIVNTP